jgi:hypothetical protein
VLGALCLIAGATPSHADDRSISLVRPGAHDYWGSEGGTQEDQHGVFWGGWFTREYFTYEPYFIDKKLYWGRILIDKKLGEWETALKILDKHLSSTTTAIARIQRGDCVDRGPVVFAADQDRPRAVLIMMENGVTIFDEAAEPDLSKTVLIKLRLVETKDPQHRYVFKVVGRKQLKKHYCGYLGHDDPDGKELDEILARYANEK